jgi:hypothetical protein
MKGSIDSVKVVMVFATLVSAAMFANLCMMHCTPTVTPSVALDAGASMSVQDSGDPCDAMCSNLRKLGCSAGNTADGGDSCEAVCERSVGVFDLHTSCVNSARSKTEVVQCGISCP